MGRVSAEIRHREPGQLETGTEGSEERIREPGWWERARRALLNMVLEPRTEVYDMYA